MYALQSRARHRPKNTITRVRVNTMASSGVSRAQENKRIRQEALREQLSKGKHIEHVIEISNKLNDLDSELDALEITRLKAAADLKMKVVDKYLPALKQTDMDINADITATEKTRGELEARLLASGINPEELPE